MSIYSENLVGKSKAILQTKAFVEEVAGSDQPVLLLGETCFLQNKHVQKEGKNEKSFVTSLNGGNFNCID